jgi:hypothetical protein
LSINSQTVFAKAIGWVTLALLPTTGKQPAEAVIEWQEAGSD